MLIVIMPGNVYKNIHESRLQTLSRPVNIHWTGHGVVTCAGRSLVNGATWLLTYAHIQKKNLLDATDVIGCLRLEETSDYIKGYTQVRKPMRA